MFGRPFCSSLVQSIHPSVHPSVRPSNNQSVSTIRLLMLLCNCSFYVFVFSNQSFRYLFRFYFHFILSFVFLFIPFPFLYRHRRYMSASLPPPPFCSASSLCPSVNQSPVRFLRTVANPTSPGAIRIARHIFPSLAAPNALGLRHGSVERVPCFVAANYDVTSITSL